MGIFGAHIDSTNNIINQIEEIKKAGGNAVQLFVFNQPKYFNTYSKLKVYLKANSMHCLVHGSYAINLARPMDEYSHQVNMLMSEIKIANQIGAFGIVVHMGKSLELPKEQALNNMFMNLLYVHNQTKKYQNVKIILETPAGQGTEIGYSIEDFAYFFNKLAKHNNPDIVNRFRVCIDTCHVFAAGYDLRTKTTVNMFLATIQELIGIKFLAALHLNDSKNDIGSNVDRHANIGEGYIGKKGLMMIAKFCKKYNVPIILETPNNSIDIGL